MLAVSSPSDGTVLLAEDGESLVRLRAVLDGGSADIRRATRDVEFIVDGRVVAVSAWPFDARVLLSPGDHEISARPVNGDVPVRLRSVRVSVR